MIDKLVKKIWGRQSGYYEIRWKDVIDDMPLYALNSETMVFHERNGITRDECLSIFLEKEGYPDFDANCIRKFVKTHYKNTTCFEYLYDKYHCLRGFALYEEVPYKELQKELAPHATTMNVYE